MNGDARLPAAPLQVEAQLEPGELASACTGPGFGVGDVHILTVPDHEGVAKTLGDVGSAVGAKAEPFFSETKMSWFAPGSRSVEAAVLGGGPRGRARSSGSAKKMVPTLWSSDGAMTS